MYVRYVCFASSVSSTSVTPPASFSLPLSLTHSRSWDGSASVRLCAKKRRTSSSGAMTGPLATFVQLSCGRTRVPPIKSTSIAGWSLRNRREVAPYDQLARSLYRRTARYEYFMRIFRFERRSPRVSRENGDWPQLQCDRESVDPCRLFAKDAF